MREPPALSAAGGDKLERGSSAHRDTRWHSGAVLGRSGVTAMFSNPTALCTCIKMVSHIKLIKYTFLF